MSRRKPLSLRLSKKIVLTVLGIPIAFLCWKVIPIEFKLSLNLEYRSDQEKIRVLYEALSNFAADWDGSFPEKLEDLVPDYLSDENLSVFDPKSRKKIPFKYRSGQKSTSRSNSPLLWSPSSYLNMRLIGFVGGEVSTIPEAEFDRITDPEYEDSEPLLDVEQGGMLLPE